MNAPPYKEIQSDRIGPTSPLGEDAKGMPGTAPSSFQSVMKETPTPAGKSALESPFDIMQKQTSLATGPTFETLLTQAKAAQSTLGDIQTQLNTPNLKLTQGRKYLLKNKLTEANAHIRAANSKMGVDIAPKEEEEETLTGPFGKFMTLVTDGQNQLDGAKRQLQQLQEKGDSLSPGDFLLIQLKLNTAQQNLEFSSVILGKAVDDIKSLMQVQL